MVCGNHRPNLYLSPPSHLCCAAWREIGTRSFERAAFEHAYLVWASWLFPEGSQRRS